MFVNRDVLYVLELLKCGLILIKFYFLKNKLWEFGIYIVVFGGWLFFFYGFYLLNID